jgi:hypothetical protein
MADTKYRFISGILNLPLKQELSCGPFRISPIAEGQEALKEVGSMSTALESVISAEVTMPLPPETGASDPWPYIQRQPMLPMELLLTFAHRRAISIYAPQVEAFRDGEWQFGGMHAHMHRPGSPHGVAWFGWHGALQEFLNRALPILTDEKTGGTTGLLQSLNFFCTNYHDDFVELEYLKTWIALEILYSQHGPDTDIVRGGHFKKISKAIRLLLSNCQQRGWMTSDERELMKGKLGELNRLAARKQAARFLADVFKDHPVQAVSDADLKLFSDIRNDITHRGIMTRRDPNLEYHKELHHQHMRLKALMERVFLAMFGARPNLMTFSWENCYAAA